MYHGCFLTHIKTAMFVVPLIVLRKWKIFARLQIHPKKIEGRKNKARKVHKERTRGTYIRCISNAPEAQRRVEHV